ncbi:MAG: outer membrane protein assembly factor BamA [Chitinispirillaceae bacterium]|nr:outer membrane protein assembly factor BamA [Chitinispirillaceae bacterium]
MLSSLVLLSTAYSQENDTTVTAAAQDSIGPPSQDSLDIITNPETLDSLAAVQDSNARVALPPALQKKTLEKLTIKGLSLNSKTIVRNNILLREGFPFSVNDVKESIKKLAAAGLFRWVDIFVEHETDTAASLVIALAEFPLLESVEYAGMKKLKSKDLEEKLPVKVRQILTDNDVFRTRQYIKKQYEEKGYLLAEINAEQIASKVPGNVILKFTVKEGPKVQIKSISFKGNKAIKEKKLKSKFKTKEDRWWRSGDFEEELYREHLDSLLLYYNDLGYLDAAIVNDSIWYMASGKDIGIEITVEEGKKHYAGKFDFTGNTVIPSDSLVNKILLKEGKPFKKSRYDLSRYFVENAYREEGYLWVSLEEQKRYRGDTIDVTFSIYEGKPAVVRKIEIHGNTKTREKVIRREIDLLPGQRYRQSLMASSRQRIFSLNYFSDVRPDLSPNSDGTIDLVFEVTEKDNIGQFQVGAAYSQLDGFVGTLALSIPNFRGAGQELKINFQYGSYRKGIDVGFTEPWAFNSPTSLSGQVFYNWSVPYYYSSARLDTLESYGFEVGVGRSKLAWPDNRFSIRGTYRLSYERSYWNVAGVPGVVDVLKMGVLSRLSCAITRYDLDMPQFPTSGNKFTITPQVAGLGGDFSYLKGTVEYNHYFPLPLKLSLGTRTKAGLIHPIRGPVKISRYDLFKVGGVYGDADLRGYDEYAFGGWSYSNPPDDGLSMFVSSLEVRYPLLEQQLYLGLFADAGNTWPNLSYIDLGDLYKGVGFGLRLNIPMMGLIGFDFGYGLDDPSHKPFDGDPNGWQVHFLMNRPF